LTIGQYLTKTWTKPYGLLFWATLYTITQPILFEAYDVK